MRILLFHDVLQNLKTFSGFCPAGCIISMENIAGQTDRRLAIPKYGMINSLILPFTDINGVRKSGF